MLNELIRLAQLSGRVDTKCELAVPWQLSHQQRPGTAAMHIITQGQAYLDGRPLGPGHMVFLKNDHRLSATAAAAGPAIPVHSAAKGPFRWKWASGEGHHCALFCAHFHYEPRSLLLEALPGEIIIDSRLAQLRPLIELLEQEERQPSETSASVIDALSQVLFVEVLRGHLAQGREQLFGLLRAYQHRGLSRILQRLVLEPQRPWPVAEMGAVGAMSSQSVNRLFRDYLQTTPHAYLQRLRLQRSAYLLRHSANNVLAVALSCGFKSETHFGKLFKKHYGQTPKQYRQQPSADGL